MRSACLESVAVRLLAWAAIALCALSIAPAAQAAPVWDPLTGELTSTVCSWDDATRQFNMLSHREQSTPGFDGVLIVRGRSVSYTVNGEIHHDGFYCDGVFPGDPETVQQINVSITGSLTSMIIDFDDLPRLARGDVPIRISFAPDAPRPSVLSLVLRYEDAGEAVYRNLNITASAHGLDLNSDGRDDITWPSDLDVIPSISAMNGAGRVDLRRMKTLTHHVSHIKDPVTLVPTINAEGYTYGKPMTAYAPRNTSTKIVTGYGNDLVVGSSQGDEIDTWQGLDRIYGREGNDVISSGGQADKIWAGPGDDYVYPDFWFRRQDRPGEIGPADFVWLGPGDDLVQVYGGQDRLYGGPGDDIMRDVSGMQEASNPVMYGGPGNDTIMAFMPWVFKRANCGPGNDVMRSMRYLIVGGGYAPKASTYKAGKGCERWSRCDASKMSWRWWDYAPDDHAYKMVAAIRRCKVVFARER